MSEEKFKLQEPVAIVGMACLYPGAVNVAQFWENLLSKKDLFTEIPKTHWLLDDFYHPDPRVPDKTYCNKGALLPEVPFDFAKFGIPPNVLPHTDSTQLLGLAVADALLQDAFGGAFSEIDRERIAVVLGFSLSTTLATEAQSQSGKPLWLRALRECGVDEEKIKEVFNGVSKYAFHLNENTFPGLLQNVISGRIANRFDFHGTNCVIDAACASSLGALHMSLKELLCGDSDLVLTGGIQTISNPQVFMCFSKTPALSFSGNCRPFDEKADGTMLGEGVGFFALRRLTDAERDGNQIYAVIRGLGSSSDGKGKSIYAPEAAGQVRALRRAYQKAGFDPKTVELVEAHGTGTMAGDAAELKSLCTVFSEDETSDKQWCALGSIKSQIGHTLGSAGAASMMKTVLALHHKVLPPTLHVQKPTNVVDFPNSPLYLNTEARPWIHTEEHPRRAAVSSFGFGGTNFHIVLEEYRGPGISPQRRDVFPEELFLISGDSSEQLRQGVRQLCQAHQDGASLFSLSKQALEKFSTSHPLRLALVVSSGEDLQKKLPQIETALEKNLEEVWLPPLGIYFQRSFQVNKIAFLFPGQGSQYLNMGADLAMHLDTFRQVWDRGDGVPLEPPLRLSRVVFPIPAFSPEETKAQESRLTATQWAQPALGMTSAAMLGLLKQMGLNADFAAGHSFGEITALHHAGCFDLESLLQIARKRGELMAEASQKSGGMLAVAGEAEHIKKILEELGSQVLVANDNAPDQCVLSGASEDLPKVRERLEMEGYKVTPLAVSTAFHSPLVWDSTIPFEKFLESIPIQPPHLPVFSNTHVAPYPADPAAIKAQLAGHLAKPVRFREEVDALYQAGANLFIEVGPGATLTGLVKKCLGEKRHLAINLDQKKKHGVSSLLHAVGQMCAAGVALDLNFLFNRNLPLREKVETGPTTVMISSVTYQRKYPVAGEDPAVQRLSIDPQVAQGPAAGLNKVLDLAFGKEKREISAKAVGSDLIPAERAKAPSPSSPAVQPYALKQMPAAPPILPPPLAPLIQTPEPMVVASPSPQPTLPQESKGPSVSKARTANIPEVEQLKKLFLEVISEKTGYPQEIITPTMDLEADLGIDSIKRVEIFMTMKEKVPELPEVPLQDLASLQTIEQIVGYMSEKGGAILSEAAPPSAGPFSVPVEKSPTPEKAPEPVMTQAPPAPAPASPAPQTIPEYLLPDPRTASLPVKLHRYGIKVESYQQNSQVTLAPNRKILVLDGGSGLGEAVAQALQGRGVSALALSGEENLASQENCGGIVYLGGLRPLQHLYAGVKLNKEAFRIAKAVGPALQSAVTGGGGWWISVQDTGGNFGLTGKDPLEALRGGLAGLTKTLAREWDGLYAKSIDIAARDTDVTSLAERIVGEILQGGRDHEVGLPASNQRITLAMEEIPFAPGETSWLDEKSVLVVSGGARGITAAGILALARAYKPKIVLFGRSPVLTQEPEEAQGVEEEKELKRKMLDAAKKSGTNPTPHEIDDQVRRILQSREIRHTIEQLNEAGSPVKYYAVDILESRLIRTEGPAWTWKAGSLVRAALAEVRQEWGPITGLIHGAGVVQDKLIRDKTPEQFDLVFDTKVLGLTELLSALEQDPLRVIILYSSIAARFGNRGQCDYAMANEVLNKIAWAEQAKRGESCLVKSLNWGPWEGGMVEPSLRGLLKKAGVPLIPMDQGTQALVEEIREGSHHAVEVVLRAERAKPARRDKAEAGSPGAEHRDFLEDIQISKGAKGRPCLHANRCFDPDEDRWLQDHCPSFVVPTLPLTGMMSLIREAAQRLYPEHKIVGLEEFRASHWLEFFAGPQEVQIVAETEASTADQIAVKVSLKQFREAPKAELSRWEPFCTGRILMATEFPASPEGPRFTKEHTLREFSGKELYEGGYRFHGPRFQKLRKMFLHPQMKGTTFVETQGRDKMVPALAWTLFMDGVAQSIPHEESQSWMEKTGGRVGFPLGVEQVQFFRDWPEASHLRCEWELLDIEQEGRLPKFEIRVYDGEGERAPLWAKLLWNEVLIDLGPLAKISPQQRVAFLRDRKPFPHWSLSRPVSSQVSLIALKDLKAYDWLPGTMAQVYLNAEELEEYRGLKADTVGRWLAPRIAAKEWVARWESIHPAAVHIIETGPDTFRAISERRPLNQIPFRWNFNGSVFRVAQNDPETPYNVPITKHFSEFFEVKNAGVTKLVTAIGEKFFSEVVFTDPEDFAQLVGKPVLYLANHQTYVESSILSVILRALGKIDLVPLAKKDHQGLWIGKLDAIYMSYPQMPQASHTLFIDKDNQEELFKMFSQVENQLREKKHSLLVHVEGKRARRANQPVKKISNVLIDLSIKTGVPIVPVRFRGGLPLQDIDSKCDFPVGYGKQSAWLGRSVDPSQLEALPYAQRASFVCDAINQLGGIDNEFPEPPDESFARAVKLWREYSGAEEAPAVILQTLLQLDPLPDIPEKIGTHVVADPWRRFLLAGALAQKLRRPTALILPDNGVGRWTQKLAQWLFATNGPKVFLEKEPMPSFEIVFKGSDHD
jgi:malonyl CoA-acyl carrier protein transacylase